jgi:hypothetical protein
MKTAAATQKRNRPRNGIAGDSFPLSVAKTYLGRLLEKAADGEAIYITRGRDRFLVQHVPEFEPIPMRPPGYFADCYSPAEIKEENALAKRSVVRPPKDLE